MSVLNIADSDSPDVAEKFMLHGYVVCSRFHCIDEVLESMAAWGAIESVKLDVEKMLFKKRVRYEVVGERNTLEAIARVMEDTFSASAKGVYSL